MKKTCGSGGSFCRRACKTSSGFISACTSTSTTRWARVITTINWEKSFEELLARGLAKVSDGAVCVFLEGQATPMIVRKQDGAFLYATTDLATIRYRMNRWKPDAVLYVVDHRQGLHFQQLFAVAGMLGYDKVEFQHISFGTVLGEDGRPFRTREGDTVGLESLLDEAVSRAGQIVAEGDDGKPAGPELSPVDRRGSRRRWALPR